jgi:hypothetical protein
MGSWLPWEDVLDGPDPGRHVEICPNTQLTCLRPFWPQQTCWRLPRPWHPVGGHPEPSGGRYDLYRPVGGHPKPGLSHMLCYCFCLCNCLFSPLGGTTSVMVHLLRPIEVALSINQKRVCRRLWFCMHVMQYVSEAYVTILLYRPLFSDSLWTNECPKVLAECLLFAPDALTPNRKTQK